MGQNVRVYSLVSALLAATVVLAPSTASADLTSRLRHLAGKSGVVYAVDEHDHELVNIGGSRPFIPASVLKVFTVWLALQHLGPDYHFATDFFVDGDRLVVRGRGDPFLVSEELDLVAAALRTRLADRRLRGVVIDDSYFAPHVRVPGVGRTTNSYDALNAATAVNFNTIAVRKRGGAVMPGEPQTPVTPLARALARAQAADGWFRFQIGDQPEEVRRYAGELLAAKLREHGVQVGGEVAEGQAPNGSPLYVHANSRSLEEVCARLLSNSNNYMANQVFLAIGATVEGPPASLSKSVAVARRALDAHPPLRDVHMVEGSGIAYENRVTARSVTALLALFEPYRNLLKLENGTRHKTGTLRSVASLAGYLDTPAHGTVRYAIALDGAGRDRRWQILDLLEQSEMPGPAARTD